VIRFNNKYLVIYICLFCVYLFSFLFYKGNISPLIQHSNAFKGTSKQFIRTEQTSDYIDHESVFLEKNQIRLHKMPHNDLDEIFSCEKTGNTNCYISVLSFNIDDKNSFIRNNLIEGSMPLNNQILVNDYLAKRLKLKIGNKITFKNSFFYYNLEVSGIIKNFHGFPDFKPDALYYCCTNFGAEYYNKIDGSFYNFSDIKEGAFHAEPMFEYIKNITNKIYIRFTVLIFILSLSIFIIFLFISKNECLRKHYRYLYKLGNTSYFIIVNITKDFCRLLLIILFMNLIILSIGSLTVFLINMLISLLFLFLIFVPEVFKYENLRNQ